MPIRLLYLMFAPISSKSPASRRRDQLTPVGLRRRGIH
jgi:hypothetical protein